MKVCDNCNISFVGVEEYENCEFCGEPVREMTGKEIDDYYDWYHRQR